MKQIQSEIIIAASAQRVWQVLTDFSAFSQWNPFIKSAHGELAVGEKLEVRIEPPKGMGMTFRPRVLSVVTERELRWVGHLMVPGLFDGQHSFVIDPQGEEQVTFVQGEKFTGLLVPVLGMTGLFKNTLLGFEAMNQALKSRAEQRS